MCGIAGYFGSSEIDRARIERCLDLMKRRGPDFSACRHWVNPADRQVYLLHSRLSIIDLDERAHQPFQYGSKWMVYNGELYNYLELRKDLSASGQRFTTESDTEVLLRVIAEPGWDALDRCEGMWAFAVYDEADGSLTLARDRFGEKPMFVYEDATGVYFGSEVKFIQALLGRRLAVNVDHLRRYLVNGYKALYKEPHTFFAGLSELPKASRVSFNLNGCRATAAYWQPRCKPEEGMTYREAVEGAKERLIRSVELRLRADVPLAFCMSGGIDSNSLIGIAKNVFGYDVHGFTIVNTDARYEEQDMVEHAVSEFGIRHTAVPLERGGFLENLRTLVRQHDAPVYTITYYAHWVLMGQIAAEGYRISVSGTAADELFTGYYDHHLAYLYEVRNDPELFADAVKAWEQWVKPLVRNPFLREPDAFIQDPQLRDHVFLNATDFEGYLTTPWHEPFREARYTGSLLRNRMLNELLNENVPVILHEDDLNAMYYSIENRSPFLDRHLFDFCYRVPTKLLVRKGRAKAILRDAMDGIVPQAVLNNPRKVGFNAPIESLLDLEDAEIRRALLAPSPVFEHVRRDKIEALIEKRALPNSESKFLFNFLNSKLFLEEFGA
jgi:asparagine synthase (glutamine-hydrolysing)